MEGGAVGSEPPAVAQPQSQPRSQPSAAAATATRSTSRPTRSKRRRTAADAGIGGDSLWAAVAEPAFDGDDSSSAAPRPRRKATSFARIAIGDKCAGGGCDAPKDRQPCTSINAHGLGCDLRTLKVPPFYIENYAAYPEYAAFSVMKKPRQMLLHLINARKMIQKAAPILTTCTPFACDSHLLYPNPVAEGGIPLWLRVGGEYAAFIPAASLEQSMQRMFEVGGDAPESKTPVAALGKAVVAMKRAFGTDNVKNKSAGAVSAKIAEGDADRILAYVSNPYLPICVPAEAFGGQTAFTEKVYADGDKRHPMLLNKPIYTGYVTASKTPVMGEWGKKVVPEKYQNEYSKYYRMGKGYLLSAFEHLRAAALIFGAATDDEVARDPEYNHLTPEQYNMLYWAYATLRVAEHRVEAYGPNVGAAGRGGKVFKGRILKFENMTDYVVYHVFAELLVRYAVAETNKSAFARKYAAQNSVSAENVRKLVEIRKTSPLRDIIGDARQAFALVVE